MAVASILTLCDQGELVIPKPLPPEGATAVSYWNTMRRAKQLNPLVGPWQVPLESGLEPAADLDFAPGTAFRVQRELPPDGEFEELLYRFRDRDDEPIQGVTAEQFELEGIRHPERYRFLADWLAEASAGRPLRRIVDAGAGPAFLTNLVAARWPEAKVTAVDRSSDMARLASSRSGDRGIEVVEGDIREIGQIQNGGLDAIVSRRMIHRVDDLHAVLGAMIASLEPGGILVNYSFRRPCTTPDREAFRVAASLRSGHPALYAAYVRAVLNAPSLHEYGEALNEVATKLQVRSVRVLIYPFDLGFVVER